MPEETLLELERHAAYTRRQFATVATWQYSVDTEKRAAWRKARNTMNRASYAYRKAYEAKERKDVELHLEWLAQGQELKSWARECAKDEQIDCFITEG